MEEDPKNTINQLKKQLECKRWKTHTVGAKIVREMYGLLHAEHAHRAIIITTKQAQ